MTLAQLKTQLATTNYPVAYDHFEGSGQAMPYIVYKEISTNNFKFDNKVYQKQTEIQVELHTATKDLTAEGALETALSQFSWDKTYEFDTNEQQHINYYSIYLI